MFNDDRLNSINAVEKLRELLRNKRMLLVGDSTMRILGLGICALLDLEVSICQKLTDGVSGHKHIKKVILKIRGIANLAFGHSLKN